MAEGVAAERSLLKNAVVQLSVRCPEDSQQHKAITGGVSRPWAAGVRSQLGSSLAPVREEAAPSSVQGREVRSQRQPSGASRPAFSGSAKLSC